MDSEIKNYLLNIELGKLQSYKKMGVISLSTSISQGPEYVALKEALENNLLFYTERKLFIWHFLGLLKARKQRLCQVLGGEWDLGLIRRCVDDDLVRTFTENISALNVDQHGFEEE